MVSTSEIMADIIRKTVRDHHVELTLVVGTLAPIVVLGGPTTDVMLIQIHMRTTFIRGLVGMLSKPN